MSLIRGLLRRMLGVSSRDAGFSLIEVVTAMSIFGVVSASLIGVITSAGVADSRARQKTIALELAQQQVEYVRQLNYANAGVCYTFATDGTCTVGGNPPGSVPATQSKQVAGLWYTLTTRITYVDDPVPTSLATFANYKQIRVIVTRAPDGKELTRIVTYLSSSTRAPAGGLNNGIINVSVRDAITQELLGGAAVELSKTWDAAFSASDTTESLIGTPTFGQATFVALEATPTSPLGYYEVLASLNGYGMLAEDMPPNDPGHLQLAPSGTTPTTVHLYKGSTVYVNVWDDANPGTLYSGTVTVTLSSASRGRQSSVTTTDGRATFTTIGTAGDDEEKIVPASDYMVTVLTPGGRHGELATTESVPDDYAGGNFSSTIDVTLGTDIIPLKAAVTVVVRRNNCDTGSLISSASVTLDDNPNQTPPYSANQNTNSSGQTTFADVPLGTYDITASKYIWGRLRQGGLSGQTVAGDVTFCIPHLY